MQKKQEMHTLMTNMILIVYGHRNFAMGISTQYFYQKTTKGIRRSNTLVGRDGKRRKSQER
jgi:hypothetical protein